MKRIVLATFVAGLVLCQGNMALAAEPGLSSQATETTSETTDKSGVINGNIYWSVDDNVLTISSKSTKGVIPDYSCESPAPWHEFSSSITEIHIESDIAEIGDYAFYCFNYLKTVVNNSSSLKSIGSHAFAQTNISKIDLPDTLTELGSYAFWGCPLTSTSSAQNGFWLPSGITTLPEGVFSYTRFSEVIIPKTVKNIGCNAFASSSLRKVILEDGVDYKLTYENNINVGTLQTTTILQTKPR